MSTSDAPRPASRSGATRSASRSSPGTTFENVEFGAGYAAIEDRMFLMDVLRHTGAARMAEFVGNTPGNVAMDQAQLRSAYYTPAEAAAQMQKAAGNAGADGPAAARRGRRVHRRHQRRPGRPVPDRRGADLPGRVRRAPEDTDRLDPRRHRLHRLARRRHLRQGRRPRGAERRLVAGAEEAGSARRRHCDLQRPAGEERPRGADHLEHARAVRRRRLRPDQARRRPARTAKGKKAPGHRRAAARRRRAAPKREAQRSTCPTASRSASPRSGTAG